MKTNTNRWPCLATLILLAGTMAWPAAIPGLFNTGVDETGVPLADNAVDPHYEYTPIGIPCTGCAPYVATSAGGFPIGPWLGDNTLSAWITPAFDTWSHGNSPSPDPTHRYEIQFSLQGFDPATAVITGQWATDNRGTDILLNGVSTGQVNNSQYASWTSFGISKGFVPGMNTLTFLINNGFQETPPDGPTGLRVEMVGTASLWENGVECLHGLVVTTTADVGPGSLRAALECANNRPGRDAIQFAIPGAGPHAILPLSALPVITDLVIIDGWTQPGSVPNTRSIGGDAVVKVGIDGGAIAVPADGFVIAAGGSTIRGLAIGGFANGGAGIRLGSPSNTVMGCFLGSGIDGRSARPNTFGVAVRDAAFNRIGGAAPGSRNILSGNQYAGVAIEGAGSVGNRIQGNYIGLDASGRTGLGNGTIQGNGAGVFNSQGAFNAIGGSNPGEGNVISGNMNGNLNLAGSSNVVQGNLVGLDATGTNALGSTTYGIFIQNGAGNIIGGLGLLPPGGWCEEDCRPIGPGNVISGNPRGINVSSGAVGTWIAGNRIGTDVSGLRAIGNAIDGIAIEPGSSATSVGGTDPAAANVIAYNGRRGVVISGASTANQILGNSIHDNARLGIDLSLTSSGHEESDGPTANDSLDADSGPNAGQNHPVLSLAMPLGSAVTVSGRLSSAPNTVYRVELFVSTAADPSGYGEGERFVGATTVGTDSSGNAIFAMTIPATPGREEYAATATDPDGNTSEFSPVLPLQGASTDVDLRPATNPSGIALELDRIYYRAGDFVTVTLKFPAETLIASGTNELYVFMTSMETKDVEAIRVTPDPLAPLFWRSELVALTTAAGAQADGLLNIRPGDRIAAVWYPYALGPGIHVEENLIGDVGFILGPHPGSELIVMNPNLALSANELTPELGGKRLGTLLPVDGIPVQIAVDELVVIPGDARQLEELLARTDGTILMSDVPKGLENTGTPTAYLVRVNPAMGSLEALPHLRALSGQTEAVVASNEEVLRWWSLCLELQMQGFMVGANPALQYLGVPDVISAERSSTTTMSNSGPLNVPRLWAFLALWDFDTRRIPAAVLDTGFAPSPDMRVPILEVDVELGFAIGPGRAMGPQRVGNSGFGGLTWHGTGVASTIGGQLNNTWPPRIDGLVAGSAGVGGQVVVPMLYQYGWRSFAFEFALGIQHAALAGASVINISAGYPCSIISKLGIGFDICSSAGRAALCSTATAPLAAASATICAAVGPVLAIPIVGPLLAVPLTIACSAAVTATLTASTVCFTTVALGNPPGPMQIAINFANSMGVPVVASAGNRLSPTDFSPEVGAIVNFANIDSSAWRMVPGTLQGVICVGAANGDWPFDNLDFAGPRVDIWAPVRSTYLRPAPGNTITPPADWIVDSVGATSGAAAFISGVIAAMQAVNPAFNPNTSTLTAGQRASIPAAILSTLIATAWTPASLNAMAPSSSQAATVAAGAVRRNLVNPFGAVFAASGSVLPNFSALGYETRMNFDEIDPASAADFPFFARTLVPGTETNGTILCIPGVSSMLGLPAGTTLSPLPALEDVDWWKIEIPSSGTIAVIRVVLTFPTAFGELRIDSSSLGLVSRSTTGVETRDTYGARLNLGGTGVSSLTFRVAGLPSGVSGMNSFSDNVYKLSIESLDVLQSIQRPDPLEIELRNDLPMTASPLGSDRYPWSPRGGPGAPVGAPGVLGGAGGLSGYWLNLPGLGFHSGSDVDWFRLNAIPDVAGPCGSELEFQFSDGVVGSVLLGQRETDLLVLHAKQRSPIAVPLDRTANAPVYLKLEPEHAGAIVDYELSVLHRPSAADTCRAAQAAVAQGAVLGSPITRVTSLLFPEVFPELGAFPSDTHPTLPSRQVDVSGRITTPEWHRIRWSGNGPFAMRLVVAADRSLRARLLDLNGTELAQAETVDLARSTTNGATASSFDRQSLFLESASLNSGSYLLELNQAFPGTAVEVLLPRGAVEIGPGLEDILAGSYGYLLDVRHGPADGTVTLTWPATGRPVELQEADALPNWRRSTWTSTSIDGREHVVVPSGSAARFFRLVVLEP